MNNLVARYLLFKGIRDYFDKTGAFEVLTDILQPFPNLDENIYPLETYATNSENKKEKFYLHTSPEIHMKKILSKYKTDIYQITKVFRNFEGSKKHKIEFTMLEWYRVNYDLDKLMEDTHNLFIKTAICVKGTQKITFQNKIFDLLKLEKISVNEAFYKYTNTYADNYDSLLRFLKEKENINKNLSYKEAFFWVYAFYVEPNLGKESLTFIYDYPPEFAGMAKIKNKKAKRFEAYLSGIELVNGYDELNDPIEQKNRFILDIKSKEKETGRKYNIDKEFIKSLENLPQSAGASLGIDRWLMILLDKTNINEVDY